MKGFEKESLFVCKYGLSGSLQIHSVPRQSLFEYALFFWIGSLSTWKELILNYKKIFFVTERALLTSNAHFWIRSLWKWIRSFLTWRLRSELIPNTLWNEDPFGDCALRPCCWIRSMMNTLFSAKMNMLVRTAWVMEPIENRSTQCKQRSVC